MSKVFTITEGLENLGALRTGGQGSVYKGRRTGHIITAVKLLPTPIINENNDDRNFRNFQNEVEKLKKVNEQPNPHVVKIMNSGITESGSFPFIEMEYIEGPDLCELLQPPHSPVFTIKEVIRVADQLADALAHCHKVGVKHGDIKSNNVKFNTHTGNYVLLDFGLSIMTDEQRRSSMRHAGAIEFMAPEQHEGQMLMQTDVYSYGIILYELLAGRVPFPLTDHSETARNTVMLSHIEAAIPNVLELRQANLPHEWDEGKCQREMQVPDWLLGVLSRCLEKRPENRYVSGIALQEAIAYNSLSAGGAGVVSIEANITALQTENERLQTQVLQFEQEQEKQREKLNSLVPFAESAGAKYNAVKGIYEQQQPMVHLSRGTFSALIGAILVFGIMFLFSYFSAKETIISNASDTVVLKPTRSIPFIYYKPPGFYADSIARVRKEQAARQAALKAKQKKVVPMVEQPKKKKRKKFLGIF